MPKKPALSSSNVGSSSKVGSSSRHHPESSSSSHRVSEKGKEDNEQGKKARRKVRFQETPSILGSNMPYQPRKEEDFGEGKGKAKETEVFGEISRKSMPVDIQRSEYEGLSAKQRGKMRLDANVPSNLGQNPGKDSHMNLYISHLQAMSEEDLSSTSGQGLAPIGALKVDKSDHTKVLEKENVKIIFDDKYSDVFQSHLPHRPKKDDDGRRGKAKENEKPAQDPVASAPIFTYEGDDEGKPKEKKKKREIVFDDKVPGMFADWIRQNQRRGG